MKSFFSFYRYLMGPALHTIGGAGYGCRFVPSCSCYAEEAFARYSFFRALKLSLNRLVRCNPWNQQSQFDPLPMKEAY